MRPICRASLLIASTLLAAAPLSANEVFSWKNANGHTSYSDVPRNLKPAQANLVNVRTHRVSPPAAAPVAEGSDESLAEQQQQLNQKITSQNKQIEAQNKQVEEDNRRQQEDNCRTARMNRQFAESARANNRAQLVARYDADVAKYCQ